MALSLASPVNLPVRHTLAGVCAVALASCGGVQIKPEPVIPHALIEPLPTQVGLIIAGDMRSYKHSETRWGTDWTVDLGGGHTRLVGDMFKAAFRSVRQFADLESARAAPDLKALFEPRIEQYSFATARETGGRYYAVTVRYRINMYTPKGELADSYTLTGYGNALAKGMSSGKPLERASVGAMRDAAAKFLVQFPTQPAGLRLARNEPVIVETKTGTAASGDPASIEAVPIEEASEAAPGASSPSPSPATPAPLSQARSNLPLSRGFCLRSNNCSRIVTPAVATGSPFSKRGL
jgi:hypothetical protein